MNYELEGQVIEKFDIETFASGFQKQNIVVKTNGKYPQEVQIEFTKDNINLLEGIEEGINVKVGFNLNGRRWTSPQGEVKYFNSITGWRMEKVAGAEPQPETARKTNPDVFAEEDDSDLPF